MHGDWELTGRGAFPFDATLPAEIYTWHPQQELRTGPVKFCCVEDYPERRFYPVDVLEAYKGGEPADAFVERMASAGLELLPGLETSLERHLIERGIDSTKHLAVDSLYLFL